MKGVHAEKKKHVFSALRGGTEVDACSVQIGVKDLRQDDGCHAVIDVIDDQDRNRRDQR